MAAELQIVTTTYCEVEKGNRKTKREQVKTIADLLEIDSIEIIRFWAADKVYDIIAKEKQHKF